MAAHPHRNGRKAIPYFRKFQAYHSRYTCENRIVLSSRRRARPVFSACEKYGKRYGHPPEDGLFFSAGTLFLIIRSSFSYVSVGTHKTPVLPESVRYLLNYDTSPHVCPVEKCLFCVVWCESEMHSHRAATLRTRDSRDILQITEVLQ